LKEKEKSFHTKCFLSLISPQIIIINFFPSLFKLFCIANNGSLNVVIVDTKKKREVFPFAKLVDFSLTHASAIFNSNHFRVFDK